MLPRLRLLVVAEQVLARGRIVKAKAVVRVQAQLQAQHLAAPDQGAVCPLRSGHRFIAPLDQPEALQGRLEVIPCRVVQPVFRNAYLRLIDVALVTQVAPVGAFGGNFQNEVWRLRLFPKQGRTSACVSVPPGPP